MMEQYEQYYVINTSRGYISRFRYFGEEFTVNISEAEKYYSKSDAEYYIKCCVKPEFNPQIMRVTCKYTVLYEEE